MYICLGEIYSKDVGMGPAGSSFHARISVALVSQPGRDGCRERTGTNRHLTSELLPRRKGSPDCRKGLEEDFMEKFKGIWSGHSMDTAQSVSAGE